MHKLTFPCSINQGKFIQEIRNSNHKTAELNNSVFWGVVRFDIKRGFVLLCFLENSTNETKKAVFDTVFKFGGKIDGKEAPILKDYPPQEEQPQEEQPQEEQPQEEQPQEEQPQEEQPQEEQPQEEQPQEEQPQEEQPQEEQPQEEQPQEEQPKDSDIITYIGYFPDIAILEDVLNAIKKIWGQSELVKTTPMGYDDEGRTLIKIDFAFSKHNDIDKLLYNNNFVQTNE